MTFKLTVGIFRYTPPVVLSLFRQHWDNVISQIKWLNLLPRINPTNIVIIIMLATSSYFSVDPKNEYTNIGDDMTTHNK